MELVLTPHGSAELRGDDVNAAPLWSSDDDPDFLEEFQKGGGEDFIEEDDVPFVLDYLVDHGTLTRAAADALDSYEESLEDADGDDDGFDDDDDDDDDDDFEDAELLPAND